MKGVLAEPDFYPFTLEQVYHQVNLIIPFRDLMLVEKQADNSNLPDIEIHSALMITTKDRVRQCRSTFARSHHSSRVGHSSSRILPIENSS